MSPALIFLSGAVTMAYAVASLFFLRFWRRTRDGLFLAFAAAFLLLVLNTVLLTISNVPIENRAIYYLLRLLAFLIIIGAVIQKSRSSR